MNHDNQFEDRASSSRSMHVGESSYALCDRPSRTRDFSQRQLPTDHDCAVSTREYQTDRSSLKSAPTAARPVLGKRPMQRQRQKQKQPHSFAGVDRVTPYQGMGRREAHKRYPHFLKVGVSSWVSSESARLAASPYQGRVAQCLSRLNALQSRSAFLACAN